MVAILGTHSGSRNGKYIFIYLDRPHIICYIFEIKHEHGYMAYRIGIIGMPKKVSDHFNST